jgi:hypothetical protein
MALTNAGRDHIAKALNGEAPTPFNTANAFIGAGDTNTAFDSAQTDLAAPANKLRKGMDPTYPQRTDNVLTLRATFGLAEANWDWKEWAVFNAAAAGTMLSRKVEALGVKAATQSWQITVALTVTAA